jgi:hypothetical protein
MNMLDPSPYMGIQASPYRTVGGIQRQHLLMVVVTSLNRGLEEEAKMTLKINEPEAC